MVGTKSFVEENSENKFACNFYYYLNWNPPESTEEMEMDP